MTACLSPYAANAADGGRRTPLHLAVMRGDMGRVRELTDRLRRNVVDVDAVDDGYLTPLHHAAALGRLDILSVLIDRGARVNSADRRGATPAIAAAHCGSAQCLSALLAA